MTTVTYQAQKIISGGLGWQINGWPKGANLCFEVCLCSRATRFKFRLYNGDEEYLKRSKLQWLASAIPKLDICERL
jgi:hypothetical protein